jgi:hypothetical protein
MASSIPGSLVARCAMMLSGICALALGASVPGAAAAGPASGSIAPCTPPLLSEPFVAFGDTNQYELVPGQAADSFNGAGWSLSGGARLLNAVLAEGQTGTVLALPSGAQAVSPELCVDETFQTARAMVRDVSGLAGISFAVSYDGTRAQSSPLTTGELAGIGTGWTLAPAVPIDAAARWGQQHVRFTLSAGSGESQLYDLYLDPRMKS